MAARLVQPFRADAHAQGHISVHEPLPAEHYTAYFAHLVQQVDPSNRSMGGSRQQARMLAGRWLAMRRLHLRLSNAEVAEYTGIDQIQLLLIEAGLAEPTMANHASWARLVEILTDKNPFDTPVAEVVSAALGDTAGMRRTIVAQVGRDLSQTAAPSEDCELTAPVPSTVALISLIE